MAKGTSDKHFLLMGEATALNRDAPDADLGEARAWVLHIQTKLHHWARNDPNQRFDDLFNLVCHPATLAVAWDRVVSAGLQVGQLPG